VEVKRGEWCRTKKEVGERRTVEQADQNERNARIENEDD